MTPQTLKLSKRSGYEVGDNFGDFGALYECSLVQLLEKNKKKNLAWVRIWSLMTTQTLNLSKKSGYEVGDNFGDFGALYECSLVQLLEKNKNSLGT